MDTATLNPPARLRPEDVETPFELVDGLPTEKPRMGLFAAILAALLSSEINKFSIPNRRGLAIIETTFKANHENSRRPTVSYVEFRRLPALDILLDDPPMLNVAPNLAVEIISPTTTRTETERRIIDYFANGVSLAWVLFPQLQRIYVYDSVCSCKILGIDDNLVGGSVLPGFSLPLAQLFGVIDPSN